MQNRARRRLSAVPPFDPQPPEDRVESGCDFPSAFPVLAPGRNACPETDVDINVFHCVHGHSNGLLLRATAKSLCVELVGKLRPSTGGSIAKGYRKPIPNRTRSSAIEKLGRLFVDFTAPKKMPSLLGKRWHASEG